jgi:hypothetical protein
VLERVSLCLDGVLAVTVRVPGRRLPVPAPRDEFGPPLLVKEIDALGTVDLTDTRQLRAREPPDLGGWLHRATFAYEHLSIGEEDEPNDVERPQPGWPGPVVRRQPGPRRVRG